jgi:hypothetical protein
MPIAQHLARHRLADLFIDTWPYNAHTTASDALWAGLPVLTRTGNSFASRVAASLLKAIGLPELITDNDHDYEELAVALAQDPVRLRRLKDKLAANRLTYPLFDCKRFTGHLEQAYQHVMQRYWAGLTPGHFDLPVADFGEIKQVTPALSGRQLAQGGKSAILLQRSASGATPKIAVITPYYKESLEVLRQAHESVLEQGLNVDHFLIADGFPRVEVSSWRAQHVILPRANHDNGNTPRGIGSALARSDGYDFIAYLDADNWYHSGHISSLLELHYESEASVICSLRTFHGTDGAPLRVSESDEDNHRHVDTSCFLLYRDCFDSIDIWLKMPKILGPLCDRIFLKALREKRYRFAYSDMRTVAFRSQYAVHYVAAGLEPPHEAKRDISADALAWVKSIQGITECVNTLGFYPLPFG